MYRSKSTFRQSRRNDWKKSKHLLQTLLGNCCSCPDHCKSTGILINITQIEHVCPFPKLSAKCFFLLQVILIFSIIQFKPARYEDYVFPPWAQGVGWVIAMASIIWIPLGSIHTLWVLPGSFMQVMDIYHLH